MSDNTANLGDPGQHVGWDGRTPVPPPPATGIPASSTPYHPTWTSPPTTTSSFPAYGGGYGAPPLPPLSSPPPPPSPERRPGAFRRVAVATVAAGAIALTAGGVGGFVGYALHPDEASSPLQTQNAGSGNAAPVVDRSSLATIAANIQPTVVVIKTSTGEGSGVVLSADGYIVTNNHVVQGAGSTVDVTFNSGKTIKATIVGTDPKTDLAVVKASATGLTFASWGNSDDVRVGDTVLAIGSPLGLQGSVTAGIVSALHRTISVGDQQTRVSSAQTTIGDAIQTDAPINPGNSGGALVDTNGKLIGINSAIATSGSNGNIGVGFAIPSNRAKAVADQIIKGGKVSHPYLGVSIAPTPKGGAEIQTVEPGGPADKAGVKVGDIVTKFGTRNITSGEDLIGAIQSSSVGTQSALTVQRDGSAQELTVTVGEQP
jgi:putative serine protease PepD